MAMINEQILAADLQQLQKMEQEYLQLQKKLKGTREDHTVKALTFDLANRACTLFDGGHSIREDDFSITMHDRPDDNRMDISAQHTRWNSSMESLVMRIAKEPRAVETSAYTATTDPQFIFNGIRVQREIEFLRFLIQKIQQAGQQKYPHARPSRFLQEQLARRIV